MVRWELLTRETKPVFGWDSILTDVHQKPRLKKYNGDISVEGLIELARRVQSHRPARLRFVHSQLNILTDCELFEAIVEFVIIAVKFSRDTGQVLTVRMRNIKDSRCLIPNKRKQILEYVYVQIF